MEVCKEELCESNEIHEDLLKIVDETLPEETELYDLAELFKVFGDSTRIRILFVLLPVTFPAYHKRFLLICLFLINSLQIMYGSRLILPGS